MRKFLPSCTSQCNAFAWAIRSNFQKTIGLGNMHNPVTGQRNVSWNCSCLLSSYLVQNQDLWSTVQYVKNIKNVLVVNEDPFYYRAF